MADFKDATIDDIYKAFAWAETGSGGFSSPWIRTKYRKAEGGSDAYGPVQMLSSLVKGSKRQVYKESGKPMIDFSKDELGFIDRYSKLVHSQQSTWASGYAARHNARNAYP